MGTTPKDDPERRSAAENELVKKTSPFRKDRADHRYVCRSGRYPNGEDAPPVLAPARPPVPTTPLHPWPPFRYQTHRAEQQIAA